MRRFLKKPSAEDVARQLAEIQRIPNCEDCELLRGANMLAIRHYGEKHAHLFERNISGILTTHVDLNCKNCPVEKVVKQLQKDRLAAVAAIL